MLRAYVQSIMASFRRVRKNLKYKLRIACLNARYHLFGLADRIGLRRKVAAGVVISFTTFPLRIGSAHLVVKSLLAQTMLPEKIVLYLARDEFPEPDLGAELEALRSARFDIVFVDENVRSYNKLVHALRQFPNASIITCDDDRIYRRSLVRALVGTAAAHPGEVISWSARRIPESDCDTAPYRLWPACRGNEAGDILPLGYAGVLYPAGCFAAEVTNRDVFLELAPSQDDLWFRMMTSLNGVRSRTLGRFGRRHRTLPFANNRRLVDVNIAGGANDRAVQALEAFYGSRFGEMAKRSVTDQVTVNSGLAAYIGLMCLPPFHGPWRV